MDLLDLHDPFCLHCVVAATASCWSRSTTSAKVMTVLLADWPWEVQSAQSVLISGLMGPLEITPFSPEMPRIPRSGSIKILQLPLLQAIPNTFCRGQTGESSRAMLGTPDPACLDF